MTRQEDIWTCYDCGDLQGRHDIWFEGDRCEKCNAEKQEREFQKEFHIYMKQQIIESNRNLNDYNYK